MPPPDTSPPLWFVALSPLDVTPDEWHYLRAHWLDRTDHFGLWAAVGDEDSMRIVAFADAHPELVTSRTATFITLHGDVDDAARALLRNLLMFTLDEDGAGWSFPELDLRLYCGDLGFLGIHDYYLFYLHATEPELDFYRAFGLTDEDFEPKGLCREATWSHQLAYRDHDDSPEVTQIGRQELGPDDWAPRLADIAARHPTIAMPPYSLTPEVGVARREYQRLLADAKANFRKEIERIDHHRIATADSMRQLAAWPGHQHFLEPGYLAEWSEQVLAAQQAPSITLLDAVRRQGAEESLRYLEIFSYPGLGNHDEVGAACDALASEMAGVVSEPPLVLHAMPGVRGGFAVMRYEATMNLTAGDLARLVVVAHFAATDGPQPDTFAVAYRLEDKHGNLIWQYDECPALPGPHKHLADGTIEPVERLPTPGVVAREAVT